MRDHDHRALVGAQIVLQPLDGGQVQVVGGLVQEQKVRAQQQELAQFEARALPARERGHALVVLRAGKAQARQHPLQARAPAVAVLLLEAVGELGVVLREARVLLRIDVVQLAHARLHLPELFLHLKDAGKAGLHLLPDRALARQVVQLRVEADAQAARRAQGPAVVGVLAGEDLEQRGLARAVGADKAHAVVILHGQRHALEDLVYAEGFGQLVGL